MPLLHRFIKTTLLLATLTALPAHALVAYDNFGPMFDYDPTSGVIVSGEQGLFGTRVAGLQFIAGASGTLNSISIAASAKDSGRPNDGFRLTITADDSDLPGEALGSVVLNDICYVDFECPQGMVQTAMVASDIELMEGTTYWVVGTSDLALADFTWYLTSVADPSLVYIENGFTGVFPFEFPPTLKITVVDENGGGGEVPEPPLQLLLLLGAIAGMTTNRRSR